MMRKFTMPDLQGGEYQVLMVGGTGGVGFHEDGEKLRICVRLCKTYARSVASAFRAAGWSQAGGGRSPFYFSMTVSGWQTDSGRMAVLIQLMGGQQIGALPAVLFRRTPLKRVRINPDAPAWMKNLVRNVVQEAAWRAQSKGVQRKRWGKGE